MSSNYEYGTSDDRPAIRLPGSPAAAAYGATDATGRPLDEPCADPVALVEERALAAFGQKADPPAARPGLPSRSELTKTLVDALNGVEDPTVAAALVKNACAKVALAAAFGAKPDTMRTDTFAQTGAGPLAKAALQHAAEHAPDEIARRNAAAPTTKLAKAQRRAVKRVESAVREALGQPTGRAAPKTAIRSGAAPTPAQRRTARVSAMRKVSKGVTDPNVLRHLQAWALDDAPA